MLQDKIIDIDFMLSDRPPTEPAPLSVSIRIKTESGRTESWEITHEALRQLLIRAAKIQPGQKPN